MLAEVNGVKLAYSDTGAGPELTVLLVHGYPLNRSMWEPQLGALRSRYRVVAPDLRGFGASEAGTDGALTVEQHADDLAALLDVLGIVEPVVYCGLSMGGYIGFAFWRRHRARVRAFVLADTRAAADSEEARANRHVLIAETERRQSAEAAIEAMMPKLLAPGLRSDSLPSLSSRAMMASTSPATIVAGARGLAARPDSLELLGSIDVPVLIVVGEHDLLTPPSDSEAMLARLPNARLERIDQAGHMANLENPEHFNSVVLEFLSAVTGATATVSSNDRP